MFFTCIWIKVLLLFWTVHFDLILWRSIILFLPEGWWDIGLEHCLTKGVMIYSIVLPEGWWDTGLEHCLTRGVMGYRSSTARTGLGTITSNSASRPQMSTNSTLAGTPSVWTYCERNNTTIVGSLTDGHNKSIFETYARSNSYLY